MTYYVLSGTVNPTHTLTHSVLCYVSIALLSFVCVHLSCIIKVTYTTTHRDSILGFCAPRSDMLQPSWENDRRYVSVKNVCRWWVLIKLVTLSGCTHRGRCKTWVCHCCLIHPLTTSLATFNVACSTVTCPGKLVTFDVLRGCRYVSLLYAWVALQ